MTALPEALSRELDRLAALPRCPRGSLTALAGEYGRSRKCLAVIVHNRRHGHSRRGASNASIDRSPLTFLPPALRADYFALKRNRYTRAEALAALGVTAEARP